MRYKKCHLGFALPGQARVWVRLVLLLHLLGRQVMAKTSADLWFRPLTPHSVASDDAGAGGASGNRLRGDRGRLGAMILFVVS